MAVFALPLIAVPVVFAVLLLWLEGTELTGVPARYDFVACTAIAVSIGLGALALPLYRWSESRPPDGTRRSRGEQWRRGLLGTLAWTVLVAAVIGFGDLVFREFQRTAQNHPWGSAVLIALAAFLALAIVAIVEWRAGASLMTPAAVSIVPGIAIFALALAGSIAGQTVRDSGVLHSYCYYGAVSNAQITGCLDHVTSDQIDKLDTDAARFAKGELTSCLSDSGPFCAQALNELNNAPAGQ